MEKASGASDLCRRALQTVTEYRMCGQGDRIAVGVSGGADSVALLAFLCSLRKELSLKLLVCHVNHCLRGGESDGDEAFVRELAQRQGLEFHLLRFDAAAEAKAAGRGMEEYARERRYAFFGELSQPGGRVAVAHTLTDAMETLIFNLTRGTGVQGLCGIPYRRDDIIRPLRDCTRGQVEAYLAELGQPFRTDSTNLEDDHSRNYIRLHVIPALERLNPALDEAFARVMEQMEEQRRMTEELAARAREQLARGPRSCERAGFLALPPPVRGLLLRQWLEEAGVSPSQRLIALMGQTARAGSGAVELTRGIRFVAGPEVLLLEIQPPPLPPLRVELTLPEPGERVVFPLWEGKQLRISCFSEEITELTEKFYNIDLKNLVRCDKIEEHVFAHTPKIGDSICLQGRAHGLFARYRVGGRGLSASQISRMAVVEDENGVVWAECLGRDETREAGEPGACLYSFEVLEET